MRFITRLAATTAAGILGFAALALTGPTAGAAPGVTLVGSAPITAHGPATITFSYVITVPSDVSSTLFTTHQASAVPASASGVTIDGSAVPAGQITRPSSVDIAVQTGAQPTDGLTAGTHTLTFQVSLSASGSASASSTATLTWVDGGGAETVTSAPVVVQVNQPDLAVTLTPDTGEDQVGFLGTGSNLDLFVDVANNGYGTPLSTLTITLPTGMTLGPDGVTRDSDGSSVTCMDGPGTSVVCDLGQLVRGAADPTLDIELTTLAPEPIGSTVPVTVSAAPEAGEGTDANSANDAATVQVLYTGTARLSYQISPSASKVKLGQSTKVTLTVHNQGPQSAPETLALAIILGSQFTVTDFTGASEPSAAGGNPALTPTLVQQAHLLAAPKVATGGVATAPAATGGTGVLWFIGDLAPGASQSAVLTMKATALGKSQIQLLALSGAGDPNCNETQCTPTTLSLSVVAAGTSSPVPAAATSTPAGPALANTGSSSRPALLGAGLLLVGIGLMLGARRRMVAGR